MYLGFQARRAQGIDVEMRVYFVIDVSEPSFPYFKSKIGVVYDPLKS